MPGDDLSNAPLKPPICTGLSTVYRMPDAWDAQKKAAGREARRQVYYTICACLELGLCTQPEHASVHVVETRVGRACAIARQAVRRRVHATRGIRRAYGTQVRAGRDSQWSRR